MPATLTPCPTSKIEGPGTPLKMKDKVEQAMKVVPPEAALKPKGNAGWMEFLAVAASGEETSEASLVVLLGRHMRSPHTEHHAISFQYCNYCAQAVS